MHSCIGLKMALVNPLWWRTLFPGPWPNRWHFLKFLFIIPCRMSFPVFYHSCRCRFFSVFPHQMGNWKPKTENGELCRILKNSAEFFSRFRVWAFVPRLIPHKTGIYSNFPWLRNIPKSSGELLDVSCLTPFWLNRRHLLKFLFIIKNVQYGPYFIFMTFSPLFTFSPSNGELKTLANYLK
jgi:hypothetical protein